MNLINTKYLINTMNTSYLYGINSASDIRPFISVFADAFKTGVLCEDFADLFTITILKGFNADGTDRMIISDA